MAYFYSALNNAFYPDELRDVYEASRNWPDDLIAVSDETFTEYSGMPPEGKTRGATEDGMPAWVDIPPLSHEEEIAAAEAEKQYRIDQANEYINSKQWPGKAALGRLTDDEKAQYNEWLDYLDALESVDISSAPDINWPESPEE
ncbi:MULTISPECIES: tail fiber assembly protein [Enterobacterales]|jgi:hypothetical protein|uniref:tail fiber assembly protein n=1 Tax=Enterobacterales TaxID=91347 RepID=UPI00073CAC66|nr:tail fiber assembly protein [Escherichia coli]AQV21315.1 tail fiber assembly protein [Escherichia coli]EES5528617.1 tail fiber assembly protein [Escherichia coli]EFE7794020.1 tail fiber assembly protein [Escherichia coli]EFH8028207.1 tail fiber assembly protein [Escherichia coli]EFH9306805.1 tail fiber assembly protein [Escherichia coli]